MTAVQDAFRALQDEFRQSLSEDQWENVYSQLATVWSTTQRETRETIADQLEELATGRMEYIGKEPASFEEIMRLPGALPVVYGEATGARWLARIVRGDENSKRAWLPSWRW